MYFAALNKDIFGFLTSLMELFSEVTRGVLSS